MQRMGMMIGLEPGMVQTCKKLHAAVWPNVLDLISRCNIRNYTIFLRAREHPLRHVGVSRHGLRSRHGKDGRRQKESGLVEAHHSRPTAVNEPQGRRVGAFMEEVFHHH
jgi:L-rhamnose mutarotase